VYTSVQKSAAVQKLVVIFSHLVMPPLLYGSHIANNLITNSVTEAACLNILLLSVWQTEHTENCDGLIPVYSVVTSQKKTT
jgi:hypothetical protein